jgi:hypothetical protein
MNTTGKNLKVRNKSPMDLHEDGKFNIYKKWVLKLFSPSFSLANEKQREK